MWTESVNSFSVKFHLTDGRFHNSMGMAKALLVTEEDRGLTPPKADIDINVWTQGGISWSGQPKAGRTTFRVTYGDQIVHENFVGGRCCDHEEDRGEYS